MKEFFDTLDARMLAYFKGLRKKPQRIETSADPDELSEIGQPIFLLLGSLSGCTAKDAESYARGLAETYVKSPHLGRIHVQEDKANRRFIYEIHEGGPQRSVIDKVVAELEQGNKVGIQLANGATTVIEEANSEIFSLIYPVEEEGSQTKLLRGEDQSPIHITGIEAYCGETPLRELFPQKHQLKKMGFMALGSSAALFLLSGGIYIIIASEILHGDILTRQAKAGLMAAAIDNPAWQLERARQAAEPTGQHILALKKASDKWTWDLSPTAQAPAAEQSADPTAASTAAPGAPGAPSTQGTAPAVNTEPLAAPPATPDAPSASRPGDPTLPPPAGLPVQPGITRY